MRAPLAGARVVDLSRGIAGPYATMILGDLGAEILKVEPPGGDPTRRTPGPALDGLSGYFLSVNRNKKSLVLDLATAEGRRLLLDLVARADAVLDNYRPGVMDRLGLGWEALRAANPRLIAGSISGFGESGPLRDLPAYDLVIQAMGGGMSLTGHPGGPPARMGIPIGDLAGGLFAAIALLAALSERQREGRRIEVSLLDCQAALLVYQAAFYFLTGAVPGPQGSGHPSLVPYRAYETADGWVLVAAQEDGFWRALCGVLGCPELATDERFATRSARVAQREALDALLARCFSERSTAEWVRRLWDAGVPAGPVQTLDQILTHPQLTARGQVQEVRLGPGARVAMVASPLRIDGAPGPAAAPPRLGQHTDEVLTGLLGLEPARVAALRAAGVVS